MAEEILDKFDAHALMFEQGEVKRSCTLFFARTRIVVAIPEGINPKVGIAVLIGFGLVLAGMLLMNVALFIAGLAATFSISVFLVLVNSVVQYRSGRRMKRLSLDEILREGKGNFEIPYQDVVKVVHATVKRHEAYGLSRFFLPSFPATTHLIDFVTPKGKYVFMVEGIDALRIIELIRPSVPERIEEKESEG